MTPARGQSVDGHKMDDCTQSERIKQIEDRLAQGDIGFVELRLTLSALTEKVGGLLTAAWWLIGIVMLAVLTRMGDVLTWATSQMGNK
jgi:hypothetical protein